MGNIKYILTAIGWLGFIITLGILITLNKCSGPAAQTITKETVINNYYDSSVKVVPQTTYLKGDPIPFPVPADVDTAKILQAYFNRYPYSRTFKNDTIEANIIDTISENQFVSKPKFTYKWLPPIKTVESTTVTITNEAQQKVRFLIGAYMQFNKYTINSFGPEVYIQGKKGNLYGANYDIKNQAYGVKTAINLNEVFRPKNK
jgi:hypothetical protein